MVYELEDGIVVIRFPRFLADQDGELVVGVADDQMISEAAVQVPPGAGEALFYVFAMHFPPLSRGSCQKLACRPWNVPDLSCIVALMSIKAMS